MKRILFSFFILIGFCSYAQVNVVGYIQTNGVANYPTHIDSMGRGGYIVAADTTERNNIPCLRRKYGMAVYVQNEQKLYILKSSTCANYWEQFSAGGGGSVVTDGSTIFGDGTVGSPLYTNIVGYPGDSPERINGTAINNVTSHFKGVEWNITGEPFSKIKTSEINVVALGGDDSTYLGYGSSVYIDASDLNTYSDSAMTWYSKTGSVSSQILTGYGTDGNDIDLNVADYHIKVPGVYVIRFYGSSPTYTIYLPDARLWMGQSVTIVNQADLIYINSDGGTIYNQGTSSSPTTQKAHELFTYFSDGENWYSSK